MTREAPDGTGADTIRNVLLVPLSIEVSTEICPVVLLDNVRPMIVTWFDAGTVYDPTDTYVLLTLLVSFLLKLFAMVLYPNAIASATAAANAAFAESNDAATVGTTFIFKTVNDCDKFIVLAKTVLADDEYVIPFDPLIALPEL